MALTLFAPHAAVLAAAVALDLVLGDPVYPLHPVRLIGKSLAAFENGLRRIHLDGYAGGVLLFLLLTVTWGAGLAAIAHFAYRWNYWLGWGVELYLVYSLLAMGDLLRHGWRVERAARRGDIAAARHAISFLVGRDTAPMDYAACRRAALESLSENLTDGYISALFWYALGGLPGLVLFKIVSTMDSMVGYKSERYLLFGWCGARLDDGMNWLPARLSWLLLSLSAWLVPGGSARQAWLVGWRQHAICPGPNSGWSEATLAGALRRRLVGPMWRNGVLATDRWLGLGTDAPAGETASDLPRGAVIVLIAGMIAAAMAVAAAVVR